MPVWLLLLAAVVGVAIAARTRTGQEVAIAVIEKAAEISNAIRRAITGEEGLRLDAYQDFAGKWTIGYGHLIQPGEPYHPHGPKKTITHAEADALLASDTAEAQECIRRNVTVPLSENQFAALTSFVFNLGCGNFKGSRLLTLINARRYQEAAEQFPNWNNARDPKDGQLKPHPILTGRRARERDLFLA